MCGKTELSKFLCYTQHWYSFALDGLVFYQHFNQPTKVFVVSERFIEEHGAQKAFYFLMEKAYENSH